MSNLNIEKEKLPKEAYDKIPVFYCTDCLSLAIMNVSGMNEACYCDKCGGTDVEETTIEEWEALYRKKHGFSFLESTY